MGEISESLGEVFKNIIYSVCVVVVVVVVVEGGEGS